MPAFGLVHPEGAEIQLTLSCFAFLCLSQIVIEEENKFLKLLELLGHYQEKGSVIIFVDKQEHADGLLKDLMRASYPCLSLHGGKLQPSGVLLATPNWNVNVNS